MEIALFEASDVNRTTQEQVAGLFAQLNPAIRQVPLKDLFRAGNPPVMAYCKVGQTIVGIALMGTYQVISGNKGWIEDVVVDEEYRGQGIGKKLMEKLLEVACEKGLTEVLLFSADHRQAAIGLYTHLGFRRKQSGLYTLNP